MFHMNSHGVALCTRFSYPPNSLHLCGPEKQSDLLHYSSSYSSTTGTKEVLEKFSTMYPYLQLIASANNISDPFDPRVVDAYWIGNALLTNTSVRSMETHFTDTLFLKKKLPKKMFHKTLSSLDHGFLPHHAFHVLSIYKRTGHTDEVHTIQTMDACLVSWGVVVSVLDASVIVETSPLVRVQDALTFGHKMKREIFFLSPQDKLIKNIAPGDTVSYHWGQVCTKLSATSVDRLSYYTHLALKTANQSYLL